MVKGGRGAVIINMLDFPVELGFSPHSIACFKNSSCDMLSHSNNYDSYNSTYCLFKYGIKIYMKFL